VLRDFLEDAEQHRGDSYRTAQLHAGRQLPKRFYKEAGVGTTDGGFTVTLDGRNTNTPGRVTVVVPAAQLATAMAAEWAAQAELIDPLTMPLVRLVNSALESGEARVPAMRDEIIKYVANDLLLYRVDSPAGLVKLHEQHWDTALIRLARHFGVRFQPTIGIVHQPQPDATLAKLTEALRDESLLVMAALDSITNITGSGLLAIGLLHRLLSEDEVWTAAHVDEDYQISQWGAVEEAQVRRAQRKGEFDAAVFVLELLRAD
jgi:chaperone required for assembly of F1-ATPase